MQRERERRVGEREGGGRVWRVVRGFGDFDGGGMEQDSRGLERKRRVLRSDVCQNKKLGRLFFYSSFYFYFIKTNNSVFLKTLT